MNSKSIICALLGATSLSLSAQVAYQGRLTDNTGAPLPNPSYDITFSLWESATGGSSEWTQTINNVSTIDGRFSVTLGNDSDGPNSLNTRIQSDHFLQLTVGDDTLLPRQEILASPRSLHALHANTTDSADSANTAGSAGSAGWASELRGANWNVGTNNPAYINFSGGSKYDFRTTALYTPGDILVPQGEGLLSVIPGVGPGAGMITTPSNNLELWAAGSQQYTVSGNAIYPRTDNEYQLGLSGNRWKWIWCGQGTLRTSDVRLKTDIEDLDYGLDEILQLRPTRYQWKADPQGPSNLGVIAQELQQVIPEAVTAGDDRDETLGVTYSDLIPVLISAVQEQQEQIEALREQIKSLETKR